MALTEAARKAYLQQSEAMTSLGLAKLLFDPAPTSTIPKKIFPAVLSPLQFRDCLSTIAADITTRMPADSFTMTVSETPEGKTKVVQTIVSNGLNLDPQFTSSVLPEHRGKATYTVTTIHNEETSLMESFTLEQADHSHELPISAPAKSVEFLYTEVTTDAQGTPLSQPYYVLNRVQSYVNGSNGRVRCLDQQFIYDTEGGVKKQQYVLDDSANPDPNAKDTEKVIHLPNKDYIICSNDSVYSS